MPSDYKGVTRFPDTSTSSTDSLIIVREGNILKVKCIIFGFKVILDYDSEEERTNLSRRGSI